MLVGFLEPTNGTATIEGLDIRQSEDPVYMSYGANARARASELQDCAVMFNRPCRHVQPSLIAGHL